MRNLRDNKGFTLIEVLVVIIIIGILSAIVIPRIATSTANARQKADIATAHEVKAALDRYQLENGAYPTSSDVSANGGNVSAPKFIPKYISKLEKATTQQNAPEGKQGFGVAGLTANPSDSGHYMIPDTKTNTIMIYLTNNGAAAEVRVYDENVENVLWTSAD